MPGDDRSDLPVLVTYQTRASRDFLEGAALVGRTVVIPLVSPPQSDGLHILEIRQKDSPDRLLLHAKPDGPPTVGGQPLKVTPVRNPTSSRPGRQPSQPRLDPPVSPPPAGPPAMARPASRPGAVVPAGPRETASDRLIGTDISGGKLRIEARVGHGAAGNVYRARHRDLDMAVAVKVMHERLQRDDDFVRRFKAEALAASRLDHPNLTRVLDFGEEPDGLLYIVMEFLDGRSVRQVLEAQRRLELDSAVYIAVQLCTALVHVHARNVVHGDVKPENLILVRGLDDDGNAAEIVKVCDFGIAHRPLSEISAGIAGTPEYMAPGLFRGEAPDVQSDVYACGVVLYEMLTGAVPISGDFDQMADRVSRLVPEPPSRRVKGLDARLDAVVMKALAKERSARHASARALRDDVRAAMAASPVVAARLWDATDAGVQAAGSAGAAAAGEALATSRVTTAGTNSWLETNPFTAQAPAQSPARELAVRPDLQPSALADDAGPVPMIGTPRATSRAVPLSRQGELARRMAPFVQQIIQTRDPREFAELVRPLDGEIRELLSSAQANQLWRLCSALDVIAKEGSERSPVAAQLVRLFRDPKLLAPIAERALDGMEDRDGAARKVIVLAGRAGAFALYFSRLGHGTFEVRDGFVSVLRDIGPEALPMLKASLERIEKRLEEPGVMSLAEDLLEAMPHVLDEPTGEVVARFATSRAVEVARPAIRALPAVFGQRARGTLLGLLEHPDEAARLAAIRGLVRIEAIDEEVVRTLEPTVLGTRRGSAKGRMVAVEALANVQKTPEALAAARALLGKVVALAGVTETEDIVVVGATSLVAIGGDATLVAERWRTSSPGLKMRLEVLLKQLAR